MLKLVGVTGFIVLVFAMVIFFPFVTIWSLNTLFPSLAIPYTFYTWLAVLVLGGALRARVERK